LFFYAIREATSGLALNDLNILESKGAGRRTDTGLEGTPTGQVQEQYDKAQGKERRRLERELKARAKKNRGKARGGKREPKSRRSRKIKKARRSCLVHNFLSNPELLKKEQPMERVVTIEKLLKQIRSLDACQVTEKFTEISDLLNHRSVEVRQELIKALVRAETGEPALIERLKIEKNELVTTDLCDALGNLESVAAIPALRRITQCDRSALSRRYAITALLDILWEQTIPFLKVLRKTERSYRVRSSIDLALFIAGDDASLSGMLDGLRSQDYIVRCSIANQLWSYRPQRYRSEILKALRAALDREWAVAPRGDLEMAIAELSRE